MADSPGSQAASPLASFMGDVSAGEATIACCIYYIRFCAGEATMSAHDTDLVIYIIYAES